MGKKDSTSRQIQSLYLIAELDKPIPSTFWEALEIYLKSVSGSQLSGKVQTAARVWVAGAGGPKRKGDRVTDVEKREIEGYLMEGEFTKFWEADPLKVLEIGFRRLQVGPRSRNTYRHAFKQFIVFCQQHSWDPREPKKTEYLRLQYPKGSGIKPSRRAGWQRADKIALTPRESPTHLNEEMEVFKEFCFEELDVSTNGYTEDFVRRYFGMLHREGMPLEDLSLTKIVPYVKSGQQLTLTEVASGQIFADNPIVKLAINEGRFFEALAVAKELCREQEAKVVQHVESLLNNFSKYTTCKSSGRIYELAWIIRIAKFVYRHEIRESGEDLVPLLCFLKKRRQRLVMKAKQEKPRVSYEDKSLARKQLLLLVYKLKKLAVQEKNFIGYLDLAPSTRALNMQTFLAVSFFSLLPPRRYRVLYELEVGRTIRRGLRVDKRFIVYDELTDQSQARWYYYLSAEDYKTGKHKGESWTPIPDWTFNDGTTLYGYIDLWLNELRPNLNPSCDHFFVNTGLGQSIPGSRLSYATIRKWVKRATDRHTGTSVPPKEFRKMYVSYVKSLPDITEAELEAIAAAMGHSRQMQEQVYNQLGHDETVSPVIDFQKRINKSYLDEIG